MTFNRVESVPNDVQKRGKMGHFELRWEKLRWIYTLFNICQILMIKGKNLLLRQQIWKSMPKKKNELGHHLGLMLVQHEQVRWSNAIIDAPITYNVLERRAMYFLTGEVKRKFVEKDLDVPENWKELYFYLTDNDLGLIGGSKNVPRTYEVLSTMGEKFITVKYMDKNGKEIIGKVHWVDAFFYDKETGQYAVRVSPEIMPYLINLSKNFTIFDSGAAMKLRSKYSQKMYELCCRFGGDYRHFDLKQQAQGLMYKKRVIPITISDFRALFNLD